MIRFRSVQALSFLKRLVPLKAKVWLSLDKPAFADGEPVMGKVNIEAHEYLQANEVRVEARVFENYEELVWTTINNQRVQTRERRQNTLFQRDVRVSGPSDFGSGPARSFPFAVSMPSYRPTRAGGTIENLAKGVVAVKGRPDVTGSTQVAFGPPNPYAMMPPGMQPVGYGPAPGYGAQPMPGYGPPQMNPGYEAPAPGPAYNASYNAPMQPPVVTREVVKARCKYCQTLIDATSGVCPNCGGHQ